MAPSSRSTARTVPSSTGSTTRLVNLKRTRSLALTLTNPDLHPTPGPNYYYQARRTWPTTSTARSHTTTHARPPTPSPPPSPRPTCTTPHPSTSHCGASQPTASRSSSSPMAGGTRGCPSTSPSPEMHPHPARPWATRVSYNMQPTLAEISPRVESSVLLYCDLLPWLSRSSAYSISLARYSRL